MKYVKPEIICIDQEELDDEINALACSIWASFCTGWAGCGGQAAYSPCPFYNPSSCDPQAPAGGAHGTYS